MYQTGVQIQKEIVSGGGGGGLGWVEVNHKGWESSTHKLNMEIDLQSVFRLHVHSCTHWLRPATPPLPRIWAHIRGRYWAAKMDDISL
jgi:hypothetical protein